MKKRLHTKAKEVFLFCLFCFFPLFLSAGEYVSADASLLDERAVAKMEEMGEELFKKTGIKVFLVAKNSGQGEDILSFQKRFTQELKTPFVLLTLFLEEKKLDIYHSDGLEKSFDKEAILSPLPWKGTIIPLLTQKKKEVGITPAVLNGYSDIVDQIALSKKITLESSIGSANKTTISWIKVLIYGSVGGLLLFVFLKRIRKNG